MMLLLLVATLEKAFTDEAIVVQRSAVIQKLINMMLVTNVGRNDQASVIFFTSCQMFAGIQDSLRALLPFSFIAQLRPSRIVRPDLSSTR